MRELKIITANYNGRLRSLTVPEWSYLLGISTKVMYNRKTIGLSDQDAIDGRYKKDKTKKKISKEELSKRYREFNFSHGIVELGRQKDGIR